MEIRLENGTWRVFDLGSRNPARIVAGSGASRLNPGGETFLSYGQLTVGEAIITLYPLDGR